MLEVVLPDLGEGIESAFISCWYKEEADEVAQDEDLLEVVTEKSALAIVSPYQGVVRNILKKENEKVKTGEVLALIEKRESE